jgi:hypothetical protein
MSSKNIPVEKWTCPVCGSEIVVSVKKEFDNGMPPTLIMTVDTHENAWNHLAMHVEQIANSLKYTKHPKRY